MPVTYSTEVPAESIKIFDKWRVRAGHPLLMATHDSIRPHKVFHIRVNDIIDGYGLTKAKVVAWRHFFIHNQTVPTVLETRVDPEGERVDFHETNSGPMIDEMHRLHSILQSHEDLQDETYEYCFLRIFALKVSVIWLKSVNGDCDRFVALPPLFYGLKKETLYTTDELLEILKLAITK